jgi:hypothetical protein
MATYLPSRRRFLGQLSASLAGGFSLLTPQLLAASELTPWDPRRPFRKLGRPLRVQPVFMFQLPTRRDATSWRSWGGIQSQTAVAEECDRIANACKHLTAQAEFPLEFLPLVRVTSADAAAKLADTPADVTLLHACTGPADLLQACLRARPDNLIFVRQKSGPAYYWYEALSARLLRTDSPAASGPPTPPAPAPHVQDVVVDDPTELLWRLRALFAVKNLRGSRIVALGGPWGKYSPDAPRLAEERYGLKIIDVPYRDFEPRLQRARADRQRVAEAERCAARFLKLPHTKLATERRFVTNAFLLHQLFQELLLENDASIFTIKSCMNTIIPMAETTACLTLAFMNDEGVMAFCESDFVIIPAGILLRYLADKPVFLHNSTFPHAGSVTCAHCTCPRRMDARSYAPAKIVTHYESDYGAAPKIDMPIGQQLTFIDPEYSTRRWLGFTGQVTDNPAYDICRSQQNVRIHGDWKRLVNEVRDSHWVMAYGHYLNETGFALRKLGLEWVNISEA